MRNIKYQIFGTLCILGMMTSCGSFLEDYSQDVDYVRSWKDLDELLIGDCYLHAEGSGGFFYHYNYAQFLHLLADEVEENNCSFNGYSDFDHHPAEYGYYTWQQRVGVNETYTGFATENTLWTKAYKCINIANNVLFSAEKIPQNTDAEIEGASKVIAEAHFLRAYYYFFLVNLYGKPYDPATASTDWGVPLKVNAEVIDIKYTRNTVQEAYDLIVEDLQTAEKAFANVKKEKRSIYRADLTAVYLLMSRVYLYMQNWQMAAEYAQKVIDRHPRLVDLASNSEKFMLKSNVENIFTMGGDDLPVMLIYYYQGLRVSNDQYSIYTQNDYRRSQWLWKSGPFQGLTMREKTNLYNPLPEIEEPRYYYYAYSEGLRDAIPEVSSIFWLRSAEAYLNLAEAEAYMGHEDAAKAAVNTLRAHRIRKEAAELKITSTGEKLVKDIRLERRKEFVLQGQRWFDLRRYRVCSVLPEKISITHNYSVYATRGEKEIKETRRFVLTQDDASWTLPIPNEVIEFNVGMPNNGNEWRDYTLVPTEE